MRKDYWIVNSLYACPTKEKAEALEIKETPKIIEHVIVITEGVMESLLTIESYMIWLRNEP